MDLLLLIGVSNACFALALAIAALLVNIRGTRPHLAHLLWLLVFVKLVTPPIITIPGGGHDLLSESANGISSPSLLASDIAGTSELAGHHALANSTGDADEITSSSGNWAFARSVWTKARLGILLTWLAGSAFVLAISLWRVFRFSRVLVANSESASPKIAAVAQKIACQLGLRKCPAIRVTGSRISPLVWWTGGAVRVVIPSCLVNEMTMPQLRWVLAHEIAHVRRRDHLVRWLEWLAVVLFWWNPVVWWAGRNLRATEEICCDALVISRLQVPPQTYAHSILNAVESIACPALRPPAMASEINSGGFLERRFDMIIDNPNRKTSRWLQVGVLVGFSVLLPLGIASAQDFDRVAKRLNKSVRKGEITRVQADAMLATLKKMSAREQASDTDMPDELAGLKRRLQAGIESGLMTEEQAREIFEPWAKERQAQKPDDYDRAVDDIEAAGQKIRLAVAAGKLTREEGRAKWEALKKSVDRSGQTSFRRGDLESIGNKIRAAIAQGELTVDEGRAKMDALRMWMEGDGERKPDKEVIEAGLKIRAAIAAGEITVEEGRKKMDMVRRSQEGKKRKRDNELEEVGRKIRAAIEAGKLSVEAGRAKMDAFRKRMAGEKRTKRKPETELDEVGRTLRAAVQAGELTAEAARNKMDAFRISQENKISSQRRPDLDNIGHAIRALIEAGVMTAEEGRQKMDALRKKMEKKQRKPRRPDDEMEDVGRKIRQAVVEGRITPEQGRARWEAYQEQVKQKSKSKRSSGDDDPDEPHNSAETDENREFSFSIGVLR